MTLPAEEIQRAKQRFSIVGNSEALQEAIGRAIVVAPTDLSVLVNGPSGSGKEFFPQIIHLNGARKHKKYIAVNCGAIPEGTIDSELFGHEKGSFTGALSARKGYFEEADGGTVFLDEVAELPLTTQARLLRVLETGEFLKVGSSVAQKTDVRIVAATNVDLLEAVAKGKFRQDLYYRLSTVVINVPPLSERGDDVLLLARKFASDFASRYITAPITFSEEARRLLQLYTWPGNVRQLKNTVDQLALFNAGEEVSRRDLLEILPAAASAVSTPATAAHTDYESERQLLWQMMLSMRAEIESLRRDMHAGHQADSEVASEPGLFPHPTPWLPAIPFEAAPQPHAASHPASLEEKEREAVVEAVKRNGGNKAKAAEELGISLRTLYRKLGG